RGAGGGRGLPRPLCREVRGGHLADRVPAFVRVHRPAGGGPGVGAGAGDGGRGGGRPAGAGGGRVRAGRTAAVGATAGAALALWPRRFPQGTRRHRRGAARGAADRGGGMSGLHAQTLAVRAGIDRDPAFGAVTPPLVLSSNFSFAGFDAKRRYDYTRSGNPTRD